MTIRIYSNRILQESKNRIIEDFDVFLEDYGKLVYEEDCKPFNRGFEISVILPFWKEELTAEFFPTYAVVLDEYKKNPWYYFVESYEYLSNRGLRLSLKLDTLAQFGKDSTTLPTLFSSGALVHRCHRNRFQGLKNVATVLETGTKQTTLWRRLDPIREGFTPEKIVYSTIDIKQKVLPDETWNIVFSTGSYEEDGTTKHSTFRAWLLSSREKNDNIVTYHKNGTSVDNGKIRTIQDLPSDFSYISKIIAVPYCPCNLYDKGDSYAFQNEDGSTNDGTEFGFVYESTLADVITGTDKYQFTTLCTAGNTATFSEGKPLGVTAFRLPAFKATNLFDEIDFDDELTLKLDGEISENDTLSTFGIIDSKLYTSEFYSVVFSFEGTSKVIALEDFDTNVKNDSVLGKYIATPKYHLDYYVSNAMNPTIMFNFVLRQGTYRVQRDPMQDYLIVNGTFESPIYTDSYFEYLRSGYNYDLKSKEQQTRMAVINSAISIGSGAIMAGVGLASGNPVGSVISTSKAIGSAESLYNTIESQISQQRKWEQEQRLKAETGASVAGQVDSGLREIYYPTLKLSKYWVERDPNNPSIMTSLRALLYLYGYKTELMSGIGRSMLTSRLWFNFLSADVELNPNTTPSQMTNEMEEDFKNKISQGITIFHHNKDNKSTEFQGWDLLQKMENWEMTLLR